MYKDVSRVTPFSKAQTLETIAEIYAAKLKHDGEQDAAGSAHAATRCHTLQSIAGQYKTLHQTGEQDRRVSHTLQRTATHCNTLQHNVAHCSTL